MAKMTAGEVIMRSTSLMPLPVKRALGKLGADIKSARLRRRITMKHVAERAFIVLGTLQKVERGEGACLSASMQQYPSFLVSATGSLFSRRRVPIALVFSLKRNAPLSASAVARLARHERPPVSDLCRSRLRATPRRSVVGTPREKPRECDIRI